MININKTLFGRIYYLLPGHFLNYNLNQKYYKEHFRLKSSFNDSINLNLYQNINGSLKINNNSLILKSKIILNINNISYSEYLEIDNKELISNISNIKIHSQILNIQYYDLFDINYNKIPIIFDKIFPIILHELNKKNDSNIIYCSCCGFR